MDPDYAEAYFSIGSIYVLMNEKVKVVEFYNILAWMSMLSGD